MGNAESKTPLIVAEKPLTYQEIAASYFLGRKSFETATLVKEFPSNAVNGHPNKRLVYSIACGSSDQPVPHSGTLIYSRYKAIPLAPLFPPSAQEPEFQMLEDVFDYKPTTLSNVNVNSDPVVEWHVNFADPYLFVAYSGGLFAQDEMQVAEMPSLGHLKESISSSDTLPPFTREDMQPTPILIRGIERKVMVATNPNAALGRPYGLYGNAFSAASQEVVKKATTIISPPQIVNLIAMAALGGGRGPYTEPQIVDIFTTAYSSFLAAKLESQLAVNNENPGTVVAKVVVHTGNWGTGAFGGNKELMAILQLTAARMAGIDKLVFHTFNKDGTNGYQRGYETYKTKFASQPIPTPEFFKALEAKKYMWGVSDGN